LDVGVLPTFKAERVSHKDYHNTIVTKFNILNTKRKHESKQCRLKKTTNKTGIINHQRTRKIFKKQIHENEVTSAKIQLQAQINNK